MRAKDYIEAAYALIAQGTSVDTVLHNTEALLTRNGLGKLYPRVLRGLIEKVSRKNTFEVTSLVVAREQDIERHREAIQVALSHIADEGTHTTQIDPTLIGGFMVTGKGRRIDRSYKSTLLHAYHNVVN